MNLVSTFARSARRNAKKTALFWGEMEFTYEEFIFQSAWLGQHLRERFQIQPGERVGLWIRNCPEFVSALFGIMSAGGVVVPINNFLKPQEVEYILRDAGISVLISESSLGDSAAELASRLPQLRFLPIEEFKRADDSSIETLRIPDRKPSDLAVIIYTSGTTGRPKGAMLSHGNLMHNVDSCRQVLEAVSFDRFAVLLPMFHSFMLCVGVLLPLLVGGSIVLIKSLHPPKNVLQEITQHHATILPAIPQLFRALANAPVPPNVPLRICISGAAPLPREIQMEFTQKFPIPLLEGYGLSEASPVVTMNPIRGPWKIGSIGIPIPDVEVSVQNDVGEHLPSGETGEICVRGGNVMQGYWNLPDETAQALRNDWLLTGDIGYRDADGYYYITDRKKDMLIVNGINVYPREIEDVIYQFPGVKEAAVVGMPDSRRGEQPIAFVTANDGAALDEKALVQFVRGKLADYKVPRKVFLLASLPRNATGKILKTKLRELPT